VDEPGRPNEPGRPTPGFERGRGPAGSTSDAATGTGVSDEEARVPAGGTPDTAVESAAPRPTEADSTKPSDGDPFADVSPDDVEADRTGYRRRSGI